MVLLQSKEVQHPIQIMFNDTFKKAPDKCMTDIINYMYGGIYNEVNNKAKKHLSKCHPDSKMSHIPFV